MIMQKKFYAQLRGIILGITMLPPALLCAAPAMSVIVQKTLQNADITAVRIDSVPNSSSARVAISTTHGEKHIIVTASQVREVLTALRDPLLTGVKNSLAMNALIQAQPQLQQVLQVKSGAQMQAMPAGSLQAKLQGQQSVAPVSSSKGALIASHTVAAMPGAAAMVTSTLLAANQQASK